MCIWLANLNTKQYKSKVLLVMLFGSGSGASGIILGGMNVIATKQIP